MMRDLVAELKELTESVREAQDTYKLHRNDGSIIDYATDYANGLTIKQHIAGEISDFSKDKSNIDSNYIHLLQAALHLVQAADIAWQHRQFEPTSAFGERILGGQAQYFQKQADLVKQALAAIEG
jgi:hypothetical protein